MLPSRPNPKDKKPKATIVHALRDFPYVLMNECEAYVRYVDPEAYEGQALANNTLTFF